MVGDDGPAVDAPRGTSATIEMATIATTRFTVYPPAGLKACATSADLSPQLLAPNSDPKTINAEPGELAEKASTHAQRVLRFLRCTLCRVVLAHLSTVHQALRRFYLRLRYAAPTRKWPVSRSSKAHRIASVSSACDSASGSRLG